MQVTQINSKKYFLQGEVNKTGRFPAGGAHHRAGSAGECRRVPGFRQPEEYRGDIAALQRFKFNYKDVIKGKHTEQNILLKPGDIIIVP